MAQLDYYINVWCCKSFSNRPSSPPNTGRTTNNRAKVFFSVQFSPPSNSRVLNSTIVKKRLTLKSSLGTGALSHMLLSPPLPGVIGKKTLQMIREKCSWHGHQLWLKWWDIVKSKYMFYYKEKLCSTIMQCWGIHTSFAGEENVLFQFLEEMLPTSCGQSLQSYSLLLGSSYVKNVAHIKFADCCTTWANVLYKDQNSEEQLRISGSPSLITQDLLYLNILLLQTYIKKVVNLFSMGVVVRNV